MQNRIQAIQRLLDDTTAAVCFDEPTCLYLTDFAYTDGAVLITSKEAFLLTDSRYVEAAEHAVSHMQIISCKGLLKTIGELLEQHGVKRLMVEQRIMLSVYRALQKFPVEVVADTVLQDALTASRIQKDAREIARLKQAQAITEQAFSHILSFIKPGVTEREVALELEFFMRKHGADGASFDCIAVSGANGSLPHGVPSDKPIESGDLVTMDFGALFKGYHADMTRTVAVGTVSDEQRLIYDTVLKAQLAALSVLKAGISGKEADKVARDVIQAAGFGDFFGHGLGHGVGVEIHEAPHLSPLAHDTPLPVGCVVTVEPGIYLPGKGGVRIEDMVILTENGCENLTQAPKELIIL